MAIDRRSFLRTGLQTGLLGLATAATGSKALALIENPPARAKTYVLVAGAWHGGWCWREVADDLRAMGHRVSTITQTGVGEHKHLLSKDITLNTFIADVVNHIESEELTDVILVGHSFAGISITGAADQIPDRIRHLFFLDGLIIENGKSVFGTLSPDIVSARRKLVAEKGEGLYFPPPPVSALGIPENHPKAEWVKRHLTPHPVGTYESPLKINNPVGNGKPCTYLHCTNPVYAALEPTRKWVKKQKGWKWQEISTAHDAMVTEPKEIARILAAVT